MHHRDVLHTCTNPECLKKGGLEAQTCERDGRIHVLCGRCERKRDYPAESLNREKLCLVAENLRGHFEVVERHTT